MGIDERDVNGANPSIWVSEPYSSPPTIYKTNVQKNVYETLKRLDIPYLRVDTGVAITMDDCRAIDRALDTHIVKTLFLCTRTKTEYVLFITPGDKPFRTSKVSKALEVSRLSFASADDVAAILGTEIGGVTIFCASLPSAKFVKVALDREVLKSTWYGCTDGTNTGYMKLKTTDLFDQVLPEMGVEPEFIDV